MIYLYAISFTHDITNTKVFVDRRSIIVLTMISNYGRWFIRY